MQRISCLIRMLGRWGFVVLLLCSTILAHAQTWESMPGLPEYSKVEDLYIDSLSGVLLAGTTGVFQHPETGGIYKYDSTAGEWVRKAFQYTDIYRLHHFDFAPETFYASTEIGIAVSTDQGENWEILAGSNRHLFNFTISPHDHQLWAACFYVGGPTFEISHNAGESWTFVSGTTAMGGLDFSHDDPNFLWTVSNNSARIFNVETMEFQPDFVVFDHFEDALWRLYQSNLTSTIYLLFTHKVYRYDISQGAITDSVNFPPEAGWSSEFVVNEQGSITVVLRSYIYDLPLDLAGFTELLAPDPELGGEAICIDHATGLRYVASDGRIYRETSTSADGVPNYLPSKFSLSVFPNPFNSTLSIALDVPRHQEVNVALYDLLGREVEVIYRGRLATNSISYAAPAALSSGVYFVRAVAGNRAVIGKVVLLK